jgi:hypothetical protein
MVNACGVPFSSRNRLLPVFGRVLRDGDGWERAKTYIRLIDCRVFAWFISWDIRCMDRSASVCAIRSLDLSSRHLT